MEHRIRIDAQTTLFVETCGQGENLLLLPGLASGNWIWWQNIEAFSQNFHLIMPELRGSGRSDKPDEFYSIDHFSQDIEIVLQALNIDQTHVLGVSMGGFVAQDIAVSRPHLIDKLVLVSTSLGGQCQQGPEGKVLSRMIRPHGKSRRERFFDGFKLNFSSDFLHRNDEILQEIIDWRLKYPQPEFAYYRQLLAGNAYHGAEAACHIGAETLLCSAKDDAIIPPQNAHALAAAITRSKLFFFPGHHMFFFEYANLFNAAVLEFLGGNKKRVSNSQKQERSRT